MAERDIDPTDPGTGAGGGVPAWLFNPRAMPPPAEPGYQWRWYTADGQPRWIYVADTFTDPATGPTTGTTGTTTLAALTRNERDALTRGTLGNLEGFMNRSAYGEDLKARNSVKNTFATIASRYASKPSSLDQILADADFRRLFPNAKKVGFDQIDFGGVKSDFESGTPVGSVDVLTAADPNTDTARGWWWGYDAGGTGPTTYRAPTPAAAPSFSGMTAPTRTSAEGGSPWTTEGFLSQFATETPDAIFARNQRASRFDNVAQPSDMRFGEFAPRYEDRFIDQRAAQQRRGFLARSAGIAAAPMMGGMTLGGLAAGSQAFRRP